MSECEFVETNKLDKSTGITCITTDAGYDNKNKH